jgi:uroporphyrinogen-III synthase
MKMTRARNEEAFAEDDTEFFAAVVFESRAEREAFMTQCGVGGNERYIDGSKVLAKMGEQIAAAVRAARPKPPEPAPKPEKKPKANGAKKSPVASKPSS